MKKLYQKHREFILYAAFGAGTVAVDVGLYILLVESVGIRAANFWGWLGSVLFAFLTNKYFVFQTGPEGKTAFLREFFEFSLGRLLSMLLEVVGVDFLVRRGFDRPLFGVTGGTAKFIITLVVILMNYLLSKFLVFRQREVRS